MRLLAEVADLGAVRMSNVLFVTTAERAEKLRPSSDGPTQPAPGTVVPFPNGGLNLVPLPGIGIPGIGIAPGGFGGVGCRHLLQPPPAEAKPEPKPEPAKPEPKPEPKPGGQ